MINPRSVFLLPDPFPSHQHQHQHQPSSSSTSSSSSRSPSQKAQARAHFVHPDIWGEGRDQYKSWVGLSRGSVIWKVWPSVVGYTLVATAVVCLDKFTTIRLGIPNLLLTVIGLVVGFALSYRTSSAYSTYLEGRALWCNVTRDSRNLSRLVWLHVRTMELANLGYVPPTPAPVPELKLNGASNGGKSKGGGDGKKPAAGADGVRRSEWEMRAVRGLIEKKTIINLIEAFSVSLKHHLRGELGIYYDDLYHLVGHLPKYAHHRAMTVQSLSASASASATAYSPSTPPSRSNTTETGTFPTLSASTSSLRSTDPSSGLTKKSSMFSLRSRNYTDPDPATTPLLSSSNGDMPSSSYSSSRDYETSHQHTLPQTPDPTLQVPKPLLLPSSTPPSSFSPTTTTKTTRERSWNPFTLFRRFSPIPAVAKRGRRHRPDVAGGGENLPLEIVDWLSWWVGRVEVGASGGTTVASGSVIGQMFGCLNGLTESLTGLERILTTPLPYAYSAHLRHCVWLYLLLLPIQLQPVLDWLTIPAVAIATFYFMGFLSISFEIENPFGYEPNDLDLDLFCRDIVHRDLTSITTHQAYYQRDLLPQPTTTATPPSPAANGGATPPVSGTTTSDPRLGDNDWIFGRENVPLYPIDKRSARELVDSKDGGKGIGMWELEDVLGRIGRKIEVFPGFGGVSMEAGHPGRDLREVQIR